MTDMLVTIDDYAGFMAELADRAAEQGFYGFQDLCLLVAEALTALPADGLTTELASLLAALPQLYEDYSQGDGAVVGTVLTILQYPELAVELADDELLMLANQLTTDITPLTDEASPLEFYPAVSEPDFEPLASLDEEILSLEPDTSPVISKATLELVTLLHTEALLIDGILCSISIDQADTVATALEQLSDELGRYINASNMAGFEGLALICTQVDTNIQYFLNDVSGFTATHHGLLQNWVAEVIGYLGNFSDSDAGLPLLCLLGSADWPLPIPLEDAGVVMAHFKATDANLSGYEPEPRKQLATLDDVALALPEDVNPELLEVLLHELPLQIQDFSAAIQRLQAGGNLADLEIAQRVAHTVKGAANTVGIKGIAELTHQLEDILLAFANQQQLPGNTLLEALMAAADCLEAMGESLTGFAPPPDDAVLILQSVLDWANLIDQNGIPVSDDAPDHTAIAQLPEDKPDISVGKETLPTTTFVRVSSEHLDDMFKLADENVILVSQANERLRRMKLQLRAMEAQIELLRQLGDELEQLVDLKDFTGQAVGNPKADFDTLEMDQYNELHTASRRMVEAAFDAREITKDAGKELDAMAWVLEDQQRLGNETQAVIMQTRLIPVASIAQRLQRALRQTCRLTEKQCVLNLYGEQLMVNSDTLNALIDPLMHLLRNAVDHGIESVGQRLVAGKPEQGSIAMHFDIDGGHIRVRVQDDGGGLDFAAIRETAIRRGLLSAGQDPSEKELSRLILQANFSTRTLATQTSGRGVGMDAVHYQVLAQGGTLTLASVQGQGLTVELRIPLPMSRVHALVTQVGTYKVAIANKGVAQILFAGAAAISEHDGEHYVQLGDERYLAVPLNQLLNIPERRKREPGHRTVLLVQYDEQTVAVLMDTITDSLDIVIKSLGAYINKINGFMGAAIMGDGSVAPVVDLPALLQARQQTPQAPGVSIGPDTWQAEISLPTVLLVDDSLSQRRALEQLLQDAGFLVRTARDGIEATEQLAEFKPDIVLTDLEMPRMNGIELTAHIRTRENLKTLPVIMITSRTTIAHRQLAMEAGIDFYLVKPVQEDDLLTKIQGLLAADSQPTTLV